MWNLNLVYNSHVIRIQCIGTKQDIQARKFMRVNVYLQNKISLFIKPKWIDQNHRWKICLKIRSMPKKIFYLLEVWRDRERNCLQYCLFISFACLPKSVSNVSFWESVENRCNIYVNFSTADGPGFHSFSSSFRFFSSRILSLIKLILETMDEHHWEMSDSGNDPSSLYAQMYPCQNYDYRCPLCLRNNL